jgi:aryl-alcohol dehydrogenase-like predicted oxidoreductase
MTIFAATTRVPEVTGDIERLGIGTATLIPGYSLGHAEPAMDAETLLQAAIGDGITYVDTAGAYGDAETRLGQRSDLLEQRGVRICTKVDPAKDITESLRASLERLRMRSVDTALLHSATVEQLTDESIVGPLIEARNRGLTKRIGASTYGVDAALAAIEQTWCDAVQVEHSILNQSVVPKVVGKKRSNQQLIVRSVLCKGLLTRRRHHSGIAEEHWEASSMLNELDTLVGCWGTDQLPTLAIRFALDTPLVDIVLVGLRSVPELQVAVDAVRRGPLAREQYKQLAAFDRSAERWTHPEQWQVRA